MGKKKKWNFVDNKLRQKYLHEYVRGIPVSHTQLHTVTHSYLPSLIPWICSATVVKMLS